MDLDIAFYDEIFLIELARASHPLTLAQLSYGIEHETTRAWLRTGVERGLVVQDQTGWALTTRGREHSADLLEKMTEITVGLPAEARSPVRRAVARVIDAWCAHRRA